MFYIILFLNIFIFKIGYSLDYTDFKKFKNREFKLNENISPCEDFYNYVCSNENNSFKLPENKHSYVFSYDDAILQINNERKKYINLILNRRNNSPRSEMIKNYFNSCINEDSRKLEEFDWIEKYKNQLFKSNKNELLNIISFDALNGHLYLFNMEESLNSENNKIKDIFFTYELPLKLKSIYSKSDAMIEYKNIIKLFFKSMNIKNYDYMAYYVFEFEKSIANIYPNETMLNEIFMKDEKISREILVKKFPNIYFKNILSKIPNETKISIIPKNVFLHLNLLLQKSTKEELQSLILWYKLSKGEIKHSFPDFYFQKENFKHKYFKNSSMEKSIEDQCYLSTIKAFERNLDYELFYSYNREIPYEKIYKHISEIKNTFKNIIKNNQWLSNSAKDNAINKINFMRFEIAKPDQIKDWGLEPVLNLSPKKYLKNQRTILQNDFKLMIYQINQNINSSKWLFSPFHTSAYYTSNLNKFFIPYGVLKSYIFNDNLAEKIDFYLLSLTISHEMSHAFDGNGIEFDAFGNINPWLSENEKLYFKKEAEKMILLFNAENNDGKLTLDENIADFIGLKISYQTHFPEIKKINSNEKRKFFIQYAKNWCGLESEDKLLKEIKKHSFLKLRVNFQMMLSEEFEKTFSCQLNQPMTLKNEKRLFLW